MKNTYLFYDIETSGLNKAFDQVLQFAAIRTDLQLQEIDRHRLRVKLRPDVVPSPAAIITNRISSADLTSGTCEYEAIQQIHQLMNQPGTISLGYNTMGFDDEFLRFSFHRNLLPPYTHQYYNGCRRMDLLPITIIYWLYRRKILTWPETDGKPSLKLEHLGAVNHLTDGPSHEAMVDVEVTVKLARKFFEEKKMWSYITGYFDKETDYQRVQELPASLQSATGDHRIGLMVGSEFGSQQNFQVPVLSLGSSIPYPNQTLWLRLDLSELQAASADTIADNTWGIRKRYGEPAILLPPHKRYWKHLGQERNATVEENLNWLRSNQEIFQQIIKYHREYRYPFIPNLDADAALYQIGFFTREDEKRCRRFHAASSREKMEMLDRFVGKEAGILATRVLFRNYLEQMPQKLVQAYAEYMQRVNPLSEEDALLDYRGRRRTTPREALHDIRRLSQTAELDSTQLHLLQDLEHYIVGRFSQLK